MRLFKLMKTFFGNIPVNASDVTFVNKMVNSAIDIRPFEYCELFGGSCS
ncbi:MAG: hypothetical protein JWP67_1532 [Mucilaginibacter sp.]|nr:hypothetical protein [Mucilaginibacter sp.]